MKNRVRVPTRYLAEHHTLIEQVGILMQMLLQFEFHLRERRIINLELWMKCQTSAVNDELRYVINSIKSSTMSSIK